MATGSKIGALFVQLLLDDEDFDLESPKKSLEKFGDQLDSIAQKAEDIFVGAMKAATAAVVGLGTAAAVVGANFESQMTQVGVIAGSTAEDLQALEDKARELGSSTAYSASEAAGAMQLLAGAGLKTNQILAATGSVLTLAGAGGTDLNTSASLLVSTLAQFQLEASESARVSDVFAKATSNSQFRVEDLAEALKYGGTVGAGFGWSLEQTTAALAMFRDLGLKGAKAGTALRSAMVGAATASAQNTAVLAKYGLTLADISPDTNSFYEIIQKVGRAGLTTSDAMTVFGSEAGAALNTIAQGAAEGNTRYLELVDTLENAAGASAEMYGQMQDNVMGSFKELQSAVEEGLLTLFDSFGGPLGRLLDALTEKVGVVVEYFRANSAGITEELNRQVDAVISWLGQNQEIIAVAFTEGARAVVDLIGVLGKLVPILDELAILVTATFVAKKVYEFGTAIQTAVSGIRAFQAALVAANVELTVSTGGLWAAVAAVGAAVAAIALLVNAYGEAEQAARKLRLEQEKQTEVTQEAADRLLQAYGQQITASKEAAEGKRLELAASGKLTAAKREELDLLRKSSEEQIAALIAQGKLVENAGELRTVASLYEDLEEDAIAPVTRRLQQMQQEQADLLGQANRLERWTQDWSLLAEGAADAAAQANGFAGGVAEAQAQAKALRSQADQMTGAIKALDSANTDAQARLLETYSRDGQVSRGMEGLGEQAKGLGKDQEEAAKKAEEAWEKAFQSAVDAATQAAQQQREALEDAEADETRALELKHERELRDLEKAKAEALALAKDNAVAQLMVEGQFAQARKDLEKRQAVEVAQFQKEQTRQELEERQRKLEDYFAERKRVSDAVVGLERQNMTRLERFDAETADFFVENAKMTAAEKARAEAAFLVQRQEILDEEARDSAQASEDEKNRHREALNAALSRAKAVLTSIGNVVNGVVGGVKKAASAVRDFLDTLVSYAKKVVGAVTEVFDALTGGAVSLDALSYIQEALDALSSGDASGSVADVAASFVEEMGANAQLFLDGVIEGLPTVIQALLEEVPALVQAFAEALPTIAGEIAALVPDIVRTLAENIPVIVEAIAEALPVVVQALAEAIPELVAIIAENLPTLVRALVDNLPTLVSAIADAIPDLVQVLADNLPVLVQALVDELPKIVDAIIDSIPIIVDAMAETLPILVDGIIAEIPRLIDAIMDALPDVVKIVSDAVVSIIQALPEIIERILAGLPDLIRAILASVADIVAAIIDAIPDIIAAIIEYLPEIIQALLEGILGIVVRLAETLPTLIAEIIRLIPQLIDAVIGMIPDLITAIIAAIPDIIFALIDGLPDIITALIMLIPQVVVAVIEHLPEIIVAFVEGLFTEIILNLPDIIVALAEGIFTALRDAFIELGQLIVDAIKSVFSIGSNDGKTGTDGQDDGWLEDTAENIVGWVKGLFGGDKNSKYSGISYVPATMRGVTLHEGEAVLTADENRRRLFGGAAGSSQSNPGVPVVSGGGGGGQSVEALFAVDGRIIDGVMVRANRNGKGEVVNMMKRRAGVRSGVKTSGRYKLWSR